MKDMEPEKGASSEAEDAAKDILGAIESKDAKALNLALKRHYTCCEGMDEEEGDEEEV